MGQDTAFQKSRNSEPAVKPLQNRDLPVLAAVLASRVKSHSGLHVSLIQSIRN